MMLKRFVRVFLGFVLGFSGDVVCGGELPLAGWEVMGRLDRMAEYRPVEEVGCVLQSQGFESGKTLYFEGDDVTVVDGVQVVHGTGSEDFFNGGWYDVPDRWEKRLSFALSGCLGYWKHLGRTGGYRFLLGDAYSFGESILQTIERGGRGTPF